MKNVLFQIKTDFPMESAIKEAEKLGLTNVFVIEDTASEDKWIGGLIENIPKEDNLISLSLRGPNEINWRVQWETFSENFHSGVAHIDLSRFGKKAELLLLPGEGFGDLSHPTTYLILEMMQDRIIQENVVDVGAGSGILTLSAKLMGAKSAMGLEIKAAAFRHAEKNALKNHLDVTFTMHLDQKKLEKDSTFLMNMTMQEQCTFMQQYPKINEFAKTWITSGVLIDQEEKYMKQTKNWRWKLVERHKKDKWLGLVFSVNG